MNILAVRDMHCIVFFPSFKFTERGEKNKFSGRKQNTSNAVAEHNQKSNSLLLLDIVFCHSSKWGSQIIYPCLRLQ